MTRGFQSTSEIICRARVGEQMKCRVAGRARRVSRKSRGNSLRRGVRYSKLRTRGQGVGLAREKWSDHLTSPRYELRPRVVMRSAWSRKSQTSRPYERSFWWMSGGKSVPLSTIMPTADGGSLAGGQRCGAGTDGLTRCARRWWHRCRRRRSRRGCLGSRRGR